jgi:hypothetical protein
MKLPYVVGIGVAWPKLLAPIAQNCRPFSLSVVILATRGMPCPPGVGIYVSRSVDIWFCGLVNAVGGDRVK